MNLVIRRLGIALVFVLSLSACAGAERASVSVDGDSMTRQQLNEITALFSVDPGLETPATLDAEFARLVASTFVRDTVLVDYLEGQGIPLTDDIREQLASQRGPELAADNFESAETQLFVTDFLTNADFVFGTPDAAFYDGEVPGLFLTPPFISDPAQLQIPEILGIPEVVADPSLVNDPAFQASLLADPQALLFLQQTERERRAIELIDSLDPDVEVESRLGEWDEETATVLPRS